jgi:hypothetical protein
MSSFCPPFPYRHVSSIHLSSLVRVALLSSHHPLISCHASRSFPHRFPTRRRVRLSRLLPIYLGVFRHGSSSVTPLCHHSHFSPLLPCAPRCHHSYHTPFLHAGLHICSSRYSVIPGGSARSHPDPEVLSWLGRYQSQEAVIEAVGGG